MGQYLIIIIGIALFKVFDELEQHAELNRFKGRYANWLNKSTGWRNKHEWKPNWLFKTALVFTTDGEHFFQMLKHLSLLIPILMIDFEIGIYSAVALYGMSYLMNEKILK